MEKIHVQPTLWSALPDIHEVPEFSESDNECLKEVRDVLKKYSNLDRFGITLLHKHFEIAEDEMLLETTDVNERTQLIRPVKTKNYMNRGDLSIMTTSLKLVEGETIAVLNCGCARNKDGHNGGHIGY